MQEDHLLVEAAECARYYERAYEIIESARQDGIAKPPSQEIIDNPRMFAQWFQQCQAIYQSRLRDEGF